MLTNNNKNTGKYLLFAILSYGDIAQADTRRPNLSLDPFERNYEATRAILKQNKTPEPESEPTQDNATPVKPHPIATIAAPPTQETAASFSPSSPPYSYALFVDIDGVYKLQGGASQPMVTDADPNADPLPPPSPSTMVGMAHFYGEYDTHAADMWSNGTFVLHAIYPFGNSPMNTVGDLRSVSSVDASYANEAGEMQMPGPQLLEFWYEHKFPYSKSSVRFGVGYLGSDFYKSKYSGLYLTSGVSSIGTEVLWNVMASNPPNTTLGLWYKSQLSEESYFQTVIFDGLPDHSTDFFALELDKDEGAFFAMEGGLLKGKAKQNGYLKAGLGAWYLHQKMAKNMMVGFEGYEGSEPIGTGGFYMVAEKAFSDDLGVFIKAGQAADDVNKYLRYITAGINKKGIIKDRPGDTAGIAVVQSKLTDAYMKAQGFDADGNQIMYSHETIYEITYSMNYNKWLMLQPDLQYVIQPAMSLMNQNAWVALLRAEITIH